MTTNDEKISSLYQQGKQQEPPAHLDNAILKAAHDAVQEPVDKPEHKIAEKAVKAKAPFFRRMACRCLNSRGVDYYCDTGSIS